MKHRRDEEDAYAAATLAGLMKRLEELGHEKAIRDLMTPEQNKQVDDVLRWHDRHTATDRKTTRG